MDITLLTLLMTPTHIETPLMPLKPLKNDCKPLRLPVGTRISYMWYKTEVFGEIIADIGDLSTGNTQSALLNIQGHKVRTLIDISKIRLL